jgi:phytoene synthase
MNDYAVNLGIALQLTNIIRDIKQDSILGRIYIPIEDLNRFSYTVEDIVKNNYNDNFIKLIEYQFKRALYYFNKANEYCCKEDKNKFLAAEIMRNIYFSILMKIKKNNFDVYKNRIGLSKLNKILIAIKTALSY